MTYFHRRLWYVDNDGQHWLEQGDLLTRTEPLIVLGEPGMGKTELLKAIGSEHGNAFCRATQLINRPRPETLVGNAERLVVDALDEVAAQSQGDAVDLVLQKLGQLDYPPFVLSCRLAEWRSATASSAIAEQYESTPLEVHLEPLTRDEQLRLLTELTGEAERARVLRDHFAAFGPEFLGNPQTLELIAALPAHSLPSTTVELFEQAIETLRKERNPVKEPLPREAALNAAGAAFAGLILSGNGRIVDKPSGLIDPGDKALPLAEVEAFDHGYVRRAADTRLFAADRSEGLTYAHRRVGEFVGARWLAECADTRAKRRRLLEQFSSHGHVPASLRGLHAWLARDARLADAVIDADPMGVVEYGDAEALTAAQAQRLFVALERLAAENPRFMDWREYRAASLVTPPLMAEVERVVRDPNAEFGLRALLLQQLKGAAIAENLRQLLRQIMLDETQPYGIRQPSAMALVSIGGEDWSDLLEQLRCHAREDSLRLAHELLDDIGIETLSDKQIVEIILARDGLSLCPIGAEPERNTVMGFSRLAKHVPVARLDGLLDLFAAYAEELLPKHVGFEENELIDLQYALALKRLENDDSVDPLRLWRWIKPFNEENSYRREQGKALAEWVKANASVRQAIQRHVLLDEVNDKDVRQRAWPLHRAPLNLYPTQDEIVALLGSLDLADPRWRDVLDLGRTWGEEGRPLREAATRFAVGNPEDLEWIKTKVERPVPEWERKQEERARKRDAERTAKHAEHRREFLAKIDEIRAGEYGLILAPAQAYLKRFQDIGDGVPAHERVAEWLGEEIAAAAHEGFEAFLQARPPHPRAAEIARSFAESKGWSAGHIIVAALAERVRTKKQPFEGLSSERLAAGLFECWHRMIDDHAGLKELGPLLEAELKRRGQWRRVVRLYIEPQLRRRKQHVDRLYAIMRADDVGLSADLAEDWLTRFADMSDEAEVEMIDRLIRSNRRDALRALLADRQGKALEDERRRNWEAVALIVDFDAARARLGNAIEPELLWHLRARIGGRGYHEDGDGSATFLSVDQIVWIIAKFRALWPSTGRPGSVTTGDTNPWDASDHIRALITRLGNDVSHEAVKAFAALRDAAEDGYTWLLRTVAAEQRQKQADEGYTPPTLDQIKTVLDASPPASVADLRAIVVDELMELGRRLRGSSEDEVNLFWTDDDKPRSENECRDRVVTLLRGHLVPLAIYPMDEADMPQGKRADIVFYHNALWLPVEAKRQQHPDLWHAIEQQLERLYTGHWQAEGQGVFLVFWFGSMANVPARPDGRPKPTTSAELQAALDAHPAVKAARVQVVVLDLSRPA
ncbi:hypothetical protein K7H13_05575 [Qipengyuania citrea]|uniref:hypothetical protein n=1 Tax=Qipengyuania citrea TaxID=225971 RepID=UPI001E5AE530|nr:hypothetical protein [Qipengyuania citrea]MCD1590229.1 hypothetical protein [Qipengyuania citrea]